MTPGSSSGHPGLVPHPRFGDRVQPSGHEVSAEEIRSSFWRYQRAVFFEESALPADLERQSPSVYPCGYYVDLLKICRKCGRYFLFFAREQQYWYEVLQFPLDADCVHCPPCRSQTRAARQRWRRYCERVHQPDLEPEALEQLLQDAVELFAEGQVREQTLRMLKNRAHRCLPDSAATRRVEEAISRLGQ